MTFRGDSFQIHPTPGGNPVFSAEHEAMDGPQVQQIHEPNPDIAFLQNAEHAFAMRWQAELQQVEALKGTLGYRQAVQNLHPEFRADFQQLEVLRERVLRDAARRMIAGENYTDAEHDAVMEDLLRKRLEDSFLVQERMQQSTGMRNFSDLLTKLDVPELNHGGQVYDRTKRPPLQIGEGLRQLPGYFMSFLNGRARQREEQFPEAAALIRHTPGWLRRWLRKSAISGAVGTVLSAGAYIMGGPGAIAADIAFKAWAASSGASLLLERARTKESQNMAADVADSFLGFGDQVKYLYDQQKKATSPEEAGRLRAASREYLRDHTHTNLKIPSQKLPTPIAIAERNKARSDSGWELYDGILRLTTGMAVGACSAFLGDHSAVAERYMSDHAARGFDVTMNSGVHEHVHWSGSQWVNGAGQQVSGSDIHQAILQQYQHAAGEGFKNSEWMLGLGVATSAADNYRTGYERRTQEARRREGRGAEAQVLAARERAATGPAYTDADRQEFGYSYTAAQAGQPARGNQVARQPVPEAHALNPRDPVMAAHWRTITDRERANQNLQANEQKVNLVVSFRPDNDVQYWLGRYWPDVAAAVRLSPYGQLQIVSYSEKTNTITLVSDHGPQARFAHVTHRQPVTMTITDFLRCLQQVQEAPQWSEQVLQDRARELNLPYPQVNEIWGIRRGIPWTMGPNFITKATVLALDADHDLIYLYPDPPPPGAPPGPPTVASPGVRRESFWQFLNHFERL